MRELPDKLAPNTIIDQMRDKQIHNIHFKNVHPPKFTELQGGGLFKKFEYEPDDYGLFLKQQRDEL